MIIGNCLYIKIYCAKFPLAISGLLYIAYSPCDVFTAFVANVIALCCTATCSLQSLSYALPKLVASILSRSNLYAKEM